MKPCNTNGKKRHNRLPALMVLAAVVLASFAGRTAARYVLQKQTGGVAEAKAFYFTSDLLKEEAPEYYVDLKDGAFTFTLSNSADSQRISSVDISYSVTTDSQNASVSISPAMGTLTANTASSAVITVTPSSSTDPITVTAAANSPYKKTLTAKFYINSSNYYEVEDSAGSTAAVLTICTDRQSDPNGNIAITLPSGVIPDATDSRIAGGADGQYSFQAAAPGVYSLVLLKTDTAINLSAKSTSFTNTINLTNNQ